MHWGNLNTLFKYPEDISKAIYTTNAIVPNSLSELKQTLGQLHDRCGWS